MAVECFEQQECNRATQKKSLVAQTKQLVLSYTAEEGSTPLPADSYFCLALNETATLRALWQYNRDCT